MSVSRCIVAFNELEMEQYVLGLFEGTPGLIGIHPQPPRAGAPAHRSS